MSSDRKSECIDCGAPLKGRSDRKFCSADCRNSYNNARRSRDASVRYIDQILHTNRALLLEVCFEQPVSLSLMGLKSRGFQVDFITHRTGDPDWPWGVYEFEWKLNSPNQIEVRRSG